MLLGDITAQALSSCMNLSVDPIGYWASPGAATAQPQQHPALEVVKRYHTTALAELQSLSDDEEEVGTARARLESLRVELEKVIAQT